jgi:hypothetical protein
MPAILQPREAGHGSTQDDGVSLRARKPRVGRVSLESPGVREKYEILEGGGTAPVGVACQSSRPAPLRSPARSNLLARAGAMHAEPHAGPSLPRSLFRSASRDAGWYAGASDALRGASLLTYRAESGSLSLPTKWRRCFSFPSAERNPPCLLVPVQSRPPILQNHGGGSGVVHKSQPWSCPAFGRIPPRPDAVTVGSHASRVVGAV